jgi:hypothetical protein
MACLTQTANGANIDEICMQRAVQGLLSSYSATQIMSFVDGSQDPNVPPALNANCHEIGHIVGEQLVKKIGDLEGALAQCPSACNDGCTHGAVGEEVLEKLGEEYSDQDIVHAPLSRIESIGSLFCRQSGPVCHGIGHVLQIETGDFQTSLQACNDIATGGYREQCYQGVFMETFGGDSSLIFGSTTLDEAGKSLTYPCTSVASQYQPACFLYLPVLLGQRIPDQNELVLAASVCRSLQGSERADCFEGIGHWNVSLGNEVADPVHASTCPTTPQQDADDCLFGLSGKYENYGDYNEVPIICASITDLKLKEMCPDSM